MFTSEEVNPEFLVKYLSQVGIRFDSTACTACLANPSHCRTDSCVYPPTKSLVKFQLTLQSRVFLWHFFQPHISCQYAPYFKIDSGERCIEHSQSPRRLCTGKWFFGCSMSVHVSLQQRRGSLHEASHPFKTKSSSHVYGSRHATQASSRNHRRVEDWRCSTAVCGLHVVTSQGRHAFAVGCGLNTQLQDMDGDAYTIPRRRATTDSGCLE